MKNISLGFIGGGRITRILLQAFENRSLTFSSVKVFEPDRQVMESLDKKFSNLESVGSAGDAAGQDMVILAVHPPQMMEILGDIAGQVSAKTVVISLAPKISIAKMTSVLPECKIVRMIPNATSFINEGYNPISFQQTFSTNEKKEILDLFSVLGDTFETEENKLEGYAIVSAMLPTYFWFQWKKMEEIARKTGLSEKEATITVRKSLVKSINLMYDSGLSAEEVMDLIPVKPIGEYENEIESYYDKKLLGLFEKIRPGD